MEARPTNSQTLDPSLCGTLVSAGDPEELLMPGSHPRHYDLISMTYDLGTGIFKSSQVPNVQQSLGTMVLYDSFKFWKLKTKVVMDALGTPYPTQYVFLEVLKPSFCPGLFGQCAGIISHLLSASEKFDWSFPKWNFYFLDRRKHVGKVASLCSF